MAQYDTQPDFGDELLSAYVDGELTAEERAQVEERLKHDPAARQLVAELEALSQTLHSLPPQSLGQSIRNTVLQQTAEQPSQLPPLEESPGHTRRWVWASLAVAAALFLTLYQPAEVDEEAEVASVDAGDAGRSQAFPRLEAVESESAGDTQPAPSTAVASSDAVQDEATSSSRSSRTDEEVASPQPHAREPDASLEKLAEARDERSGVHSKPARKSSSVGVVHLTLADLRRGTETFDQLLVNNGVQLIEPMGNTLRSDSTPAPATTNSLRSRGIESASPPAERRVITPNDDSADQPAQMVLLEASPEQIEQILTDCQEETTLIEAVNIEQTDTGDQRQQSWQQWQRNRQADNGPSSQSLNRQQQGLVEVLNSVPSDQMVVVPPEDAGGRGGSPPQDTMQQARAAKLHLGRLPANWPQQQLQRDPERGRFFADSSTPDAPPQQKASPADDNQSRPEEQSARPMRVLFLLHPSESQAD